ncbi:MAG: DUF1156 domain-containing protein [Nitrospirae bacterium]|nr:DUF1156 domain-containing protein [Nitrospirota bacterium]
MIERDFDIPFIANLALREKQIQQNYRPIIAIHKWFARRPGTLFRGLILSEFSDKPLREAFYLPNRFQGKQVADPFMGGGTPLVEANRVGCNVVGFDINPMSYWIVKQEIEHLDLNSYADEGKNFRDYLENKIGSFYRTRCNVCGDDNAHVKYFLWVKVIDCSKCKQEIDLFPGYLISSDSRHPLNVFVCKHCGMLTETKSRSAPGNCCHCDSPLSVTGPAKHNRCQCGKCGTVNSFTDPKAGPPRHRLFALEYHCPTCKTGHDGRFFKAADVHDLELVEEAASTWAGMTAQYVPEDKIPSGDETGRLHRWGYSLYREMFSARQLVGLELSAQYISLITDERLRNALATNLSDLLRYQNMLCRYDTTALKSLDIFSVHGFPVGLVQCESNFLGIIDPERKTCIGSGGWANIIDKFRKAKLYCDAPFEVRFQGSTKNIVPIKGEWIGDHLDEGDDVEKRIMDVRCMDAATAALPTASLDAVFTDPPYFGNVQYAELMDFCYVWLRRLIGADYRGFESASTRNAQELTVNEDMGRGIEHFTSGISSVFQRMSNALKPGSPFAFTYHHNDLGAYYPIAIAILDAGMACTASLPCPAEMGASIHINGTGSSIIDTVFVCRTTGAIPRRTIVDTPEGVARLVKDDLTSLKAGNVDPSKGDTRCIAYGHIIRHAIWRLRGQWDNTQEFSKRHAMLAGWVMDFGGWSAVEKLLSDSRPVDHYERIYSVREDTVKYGDDNADISF